MLRDAISGKSREISRLNRKKCLRFVTDETLRAANNMATIIRVRQPSETESVSQFGVFARPIFADKKIGVTKLSERWIWWIFGLSHLGQNFTEFRVAN